MKPRRDFQEFIQCYENVNASLASSTIPNAPYGQPNPQTKVEDYEDRPWIMFGRNVEEFQRIMNDVDCEVFDLFKPVREPRLVLSELSCGQVSVDLQTAILNNCSCTLCKGVCRVAMTIKDCGHRFCNDCIQRWIRKGHTTCPECPHVKLPSRRYLRPNKDFDELIEKLLPDLENVEKAAGILQKRSAVKAKERSDLSGTNSSDGFNEDEDEAMDGSVASETSEDEDDDDSDEIADEIENEDDSEENEDLTDDDERSRPPRRGPMQPRRPVYLPSPPQPTNLPLMAKSAYGQNLDELYADDMGYLEIFLVCLNGNLPSAVCSMARELSKRPMKLPVTATTRDAAMILAEKLVRDVLGPFDVHSIITDLSFVRDGDIWPAIAQIPLSEVCRQVTESRGPIALRYLLSDRLYSLCERIEAS